jgi:phage replication-related protein YjqB (UPF0714/DUF867 family)
MPDLYRSMTELLRLLPAAGNYEIQTEESRASRVKLFAPHGGCIEPCTGKLVREIAAPRSDWYVFHATRKQACFGTLHVTSTHFDEPRCVQMAERAEVAVALHGCAGDERFIEVGGGNLAAAASLFELLLEGGFPARSSEDARQGEDPRNFVNRSRLGGVQLELSAGFRRSLFADYPHTAHPDPRAVRRFVRAMREWIAALEADLADSPT